MTAEHMNEDAAARRRRSTVTGTDGMALAVPGQEAGAPMTICDLCSRDTVHLVKVTGKGWVHRCVSCWARHGRRDPDAEDQYEERLADASDTGVDRG